MTNFTGTREQYMTEAVNWMLDDIILPETDKSKPPFRITIGWPKGVRGGKYTVLGTCHPRSHSSDGHNEIFISPTIGDTMTALETAIHEAIHAVDNCESKHRGAFAQIARAIGLEGKMTETVAGAELKEALQWYIDEHGELPIAAMDDSKRKKQGTRLLLVQCGQDCGFKVRASRKVVNLWMDGDGNCPACTSARLHFDV